MKKWKVPLVVFLTALLLTALGFLPVLAGILQDVGTDKQISHRPLHSIAPFISEKDPHLRFVDKLMILHDEQISAIVPALASMTEQQLRTAVEEGLQPYTAAGILRQDHSMEFHANPYIAISLQDGQQYFLFWTVTLMWADSDIRYTLNLKIDDETGSILDINYYDPGLFPTDAPGNWQYSWQESFAGIWLEQTGLWEQARLLPPEGSAQQVQGWDAGFCPTVYRVSAGAGKTCRICFYATSHGEFMMWLE